MTVAARGGPAGAAAALRVLAVATDPATLRTIERACTNEDYAFVFATDVAEALAAGSAERPDVAFVDVTVESDAGLVLVHHLPAVSSGTEVYALVPPLRQDLGNQAVSLGAAGVIVAPPSGDVLLLAVGRVRQRRAAEALREQLSTGLASWQRRAGRAERIAGLVAQGDRAAAGHTIAEALGEATRAAGAALYVLDPDAPAGRARLAAVGSAAILDDRGGLGQSLEGARLLTLSVAGRAVGYVLLDNPGELEDPSVAPLLDLAAVAVGALTGPPSAAPSRPAVKPERPAQARVFFPGRFQDAANREIERARRHGRRLAIAVIQSLAASTQHEVEDLVVELVRESDLLGRGGEGEHLLLLPETGRLGAHACRRRVLRAGAVARPRESLPGAPAGVAVAPRFSIGVATYPHDGAVVDALVARAQRRARDAAASPVNLRRLWGAPASAIAAALLDETLGMEVPDPLVLSYAEVAFEAVGPLIAAACREGLRGGVASVFGGVRDGGPAAAALRVAGEDADIVMHVADAVEQGLPAGIEAVAVTAEHGTWTLIASRGEGSVRLVTSSDPLVADALIEALTSARPANVA